MAKNEKSQVRLYMLGTHAECGYYASLRKARANARRISREDTNRLLSVYSSDTYSLLATFQGGREV